MNMTAIKIKGGYDLKLSGKPDSAVHDLKSPKHVGIMPPDFIGIRPRLLVKQGDTLKAGTVLFESKDDPRVKFVSPASGRVSAVRLGERRRVMAIEIETQGNDFEDFQKHSKDQIKGLTRDAVVKLLLDGGMWPLIRRRPYNRIACADEKPKAVYISGIAADEFHPKPDVVLKGQEERFNTGLDILAKFDSPLRLCIPEGSQDLPAFAKHDNVTRHVFKKIYPAGNTAVEIYYIDPLAPGDVAWHLSFQDVLAIGDFFMTGRFPAERIVALAGPGVSAPSYYRVGFGASIEELISGRIAEPPHSALSTPSLLLRQGYGRTRTASEGRARLRSICDLKGEGKENGAQMRFITGGALTGRKVKPDDFIGFYDTSLCVMPEGRSREFLGFMTPGFSKHSISRTFLSGIFPKKEYDFNTNNRGSERAFVQTGIYEDICPVDIYPAHLAKAILAKDIEDMEKHGILDCAQCGLCTYICPSKIEIASIIRSGLDIMEKET
ncbi:NADH:ubiquinone reductase (Na(+)-transporting) subunit A [Elusimicrobiota bacterium]